MNALRKGLGTLVLAAGAICMTATAVKAIPPVGGTSVVEGYGEPLLTPRVAGGTLGDSFDGSSLDRCLWDTNYNGSYSVDVSEGTLTIQGTDTGAGVSAKRMINARNHTLSVRVTSATGPYTMQVSSYDVDRDGPERVRLVAEVSDGPEGAFLTVRRFMGEDEMESQTASLAAAPLPYTLTLSVNGDNRTATASADFNGEPISRTLTDTPYLFTTQVRWDAVVSGSISWDSIASNIAQPALYTISNSPLRLNGVPYVSTEEYTQGSAVLTSTDARVLQEWETSACVETDGSQSFSAALVWFESRLPGTVYTTLSQAELEEHYLSMFPEMTVECFETAYVSNGEGMALTFSPPSCGAGGSTTTMPETSTTMPETTTTLPESTTTTTVEITTTTLPDPEPVDGCPASPLVFGCLPSRAGKLDIATEPSGKLSFQWRKGFTITADDLGDPTTSSSYRLCVYDERRAGTVLAVDLEIPSGDRWTAGAKGVSYQDTSKDVDGVRKASVRSGVSDKSKIKVDAVGSFTDELMPVGSTLLGADNGVTVQLMRDFDGTSAAACWETSFPAPRVHDVDSYKAILK